jgi:hypothetical protein
MHGLSSQKTAHVTKKDDFAGSASSNQRGFCADLCYFTALNMTPEYDKQQFELRSPTLAILWDCVCRAGFVITKDEA